MIKATEDQKALHHPRRIRLLVQQHSVMLLQDDRPKPVWLGSVLLVRSFRIDIVSGHDFRRDALESNVEWFAGLGKNGDLFALKITDQNGQDGMLTFEKLGTYLVGFPNYARLLQPAPKPRRRVNVQTFVNNRPTSRKQRYRT